MAGYVPLTMAGEHLVERGIKNTFEPEQKLKGMGCVATDANPECLPLLDEETMRRRSAAALCVGCRLHARSFAKRQLTMHGQQSRNAPSVIEEKRHSIRSFGVE